MRGQESRAPAARDAHERHEQPCLSVVIATFNGEQFLPLQLEALSGQSWDQRFEVLIADNGSTDSTVNVAQRFADRLELRIVDASKQRGQTYARNMGVAAAKASRIILLDQDDMISDGYLAAMSRALDSNALVAARIDVLQLNPGWVSQAREIVQTSQLPTEPVAWGYGCTLGVHKEVFDSVGGFDTSLIGGGEDVDLCWRLSTRGIRIEFVPEAVLHYRIPDTLRALFRQGRRYGFAGVSVYRVPGRVPPQFSSLGWARGTLGAARLAAFGTGRGDRGRGVFLLGRRLGQAQGEITARLPWARSLAPR